MLPCSHPVPINAFSEHLGQNRLQLADAFSEFVGASARLEESYRELQLEVTQLGKELAERNTALRQTAAENEQMRSVLQQIVDSMPCGIIVVNAAEKIVTINPEGRRLLEIGASRVEDIRELSDLCRINFEAMGSGSGNRLDNELCIPTPEGKRWIAIGSRKLTRPVGAGSSAGARTPLETIWILLDISAHKQAELERESVRNAMAIAEVSTILAHEIRNPLASMELFAGLILEDREHAPEWIAQLRAGIRLLSGTVNNVLSTHAGPLPDLAPINLVSCMRTAVDFAQPIAMQAGVSMSFESAQDGITINGSESALHQLALNIICNAVRHTPEGGSIAVSMAGPSAAGHSALVAIKDTGSGIPPGAIDHIFDPGFSASGDRPGLGLAVCKRIMTQHGGQIHVISRPRCGSTFQLEFPWL